MQALIDELKKPEYQGMTDIQAAAAINAKVVAIKTEVDCWMIKQHALENGYWAPIFKASQDANHPAQDLCISILAYIDDVSGKYSKINFDRPKVQEMLNALTFAGFISPELRWELEALADSHVAWVDHVGVGQVGIGLVQNARKQIGATFNA